MPKATDQEAFWVGDFGRRYSERNRGQHWVAANAALFARALARAVAPTTVLELGSNIGLNLAALKVLLPLAKFSAVEINPEAAAELKQSLPDVEVAVASILDYSAPSQYDLVFTKGVLIHICPDSLSAVYSKMHRASARYILVAEYYNPAPVEIAYRGYSGKLFKRDFAGELLDAFPDLRLVDYGFCYRRDPVFPQDDMTWFLLEKGAQMQRSG